MEIKKTNKIKKLQKIWTNLGPGLTTGAADDDPSGIATYSQVGSRFGFQFLWLSLATFPLMAVVQEMCARLGLVTGRGLAANIRLHFSKKILYSVTFLLFLANAFNIGADLGAMAASVRLIFPNLPFTFLVIFFTLLIVISQIFISYKAYAQILKYLTLVLFSYVLTAGFVSFNLLEVIKSTFLPSLIFSKEAFMLVTAVLGTTISPYLFFWQTSQEIEEKKLHIQEFPKSRQVVDSEDISKMRFDVGVGMFVSNLVMFFIILVCGATLHKAGIDIQTAEQAAESLKPFAGHYAYLLFTLGIIGTGLLAVPVLAGSSAYAVAESFGWHEGLYNKFKSAKAFYLTIAFSMLAGLGMNFFNINPIKALIYSAIFNGMLAPFALALIVWLSSSKKIMGRHVNSMPLRIIGWFVVASMLISAIPTFYWFIFP